MKGQTLPVEVLEAYLEDKNISFAMKKSIKILYYLMEYDQIFGRSAVEDMLSCSYRTAGNIISVMKEAGIIETVKGKGKGRYIFNIKK